MTQQRKPSAPHDAPLKSLDPRDETLLSSDLHDASFKSSVTHDATAAAHTLTITILFPRLSTDSLELLGRVSRRTLIQVPLRTPVVRICVNSAGGVDSEKGWRIRCDTRLVFEWAHVRIPNKAWMYLQEKMSDFRLKWIPVSNGKQRTPAVLCSDHRL
ncbi:hypothetical protein TNCV_1041471 [Trichonephila clavipes]|nr:hypothetical protein TNCV_1041471 [Trichonephila clavipes]